MRSFLGKRITPQTPPEELAALGEAGRLMQSGAYRNAGDIFHAATVARVAELMRAGFPESKDVTARASSQAANAQPTIAQPTRAQPTTPQPTTSPPFPRPKPPNYPFVEGQAPQYQPGEWEKAGARATTANNHHQLVSPYSNLLTPDEQQILTDRPWVNPTGVEPGITRLAQGNAYFGASRKEMKGGVTTVTYHGGLDFPAAFDPKVDSQSPTRLPTSGLITKLVIADWGKIDGLEMRLGPSITARLLHVKVAPEIIRRLGYGAPKGYAPGQPAANPIMYNAGEPIGEVDVKNRDHAHFQIEIHRGNKIVYVADPTPLFANSPTEQPPSTSRKIWENVFSSDSPPAYRPFPSSSRNPQ